MGKALPRGREDGGVRGAAAEGRRVARRALRALALLVLSLVPASAHAQQRAERYDLGRLTVIAYPQDAPLARSLLADASRRDTFPGLPRPRARAVIAIAPDRARFREWTGGMAPEWGAAVAFPQSSRIVLQGSGAGSDAGDPRAVLRHELAHLALHEAVGDLPPRWFDEGYAGYAAGELDRGDVVATNVALALHRLPALEELDSAFFGGRTSADAAYALSALAVADLASLDSARGLSLFLNYWKTSGKFDPAVRSAYGITASEFERRWRTHAKRRFGALAVATDISIATLVFLALLLPLYVNRRVRDRRRLKALREADAAQEARERADAALAIDELLRSLTPPKS